MGKAKRKPRPSVPKWFWILNESCYFCSTPNNCTRCKVARGFMGEFGGKKQKGRVPEKTRGRAPPEYPKGMDS